jgi:dihydrofolate synthase/folylpolyglutamate synthase
LVSVIASISFDHMDVLGHTLTAIATEKAGIIKPGRVVVTSAQAPEALVAIARVARERQARLVRVGPVNGDPAQAEVEAGQIPPVTYHYQAESQHETGQTITVFAPTQTYHNLEVSLAGLHQAENATLALATLETLRASGRPECAWDETALRQGLRSVSWSARLEIIARQPTIVVDGAHNADSIQKLLNALRSLFTFQRLLIVLGVNADKDLVGMITELAGVDQVILTNTQQPRAARPDDLRKLFARYAPAVNLAIAEGSQAAIELARSLAGPADLICATGSLYLAAEVLRLVGRGSDTTMSA